MQGGGLPGSGKSDRLQVRVGVSAKGLGAWARIWRPCQGSGVLEEKRPASGELQSAGA